MFYGNDPDGKGYSTRAHFAEVIGVLGPPPLDMLERGKRSHEFFDEDGVRFFLIAINKWRLPINAYRRFDREMERYCRDTVEIL